MTTATTAITGMTASETSANCQSSANSTTDTPISSSEVIRNIRVAMLKNWRMTTCPPAPW